MAKIPAHLRAELAAAIALDPIVEELLAENEQGCFGLGAGRVLLALREAGERAPRVLEQILHEDLLNDPAVGAQVVMAANLPVVPGSLRAALAEHDLLRFLPGVPNGAGLYQLSLGPNRSEPAPTYTVSRLRNTVTAHLAAVRSGQSTLADAEVQILAALASYEDRQQAAAALRDAEVTANTEGKVTADPATTSAKAARLVEPRTGSQRARILTYLVERAGATDYQLSVGLSLLDNSVRPRRGELVAGGFVRDSGIVKDHYGSGWTLWQATAEGRAWFHRNTSGGAA